MGTGLKAPRAALGRTRTTRVRMQTELQGRRAMFQVGATAGRGGERERGGGGTRGGLQPPNRRPGLPCLPVRLAAATQQLGDYLRGGGRVERSKISGRSFRGPPSSWRRRSTYFSSRRCRAYPHSAAAAAPWQRLRTGLTPSPTVAFLVSAAMVIIYADPPPSAGGGRGQA